MSYYCHNGTIFVYHYYEQLKQKNMCLFAETEKLKVAKEDIKCYKRIKFVFDKENIWFHTPYQFTKISKKILFGKKELVALGELKIIKGECEYVVYGGLIHTYLYERDAVNYQCSNEIVVACIIPKGTKYIEGYDGWGTKNIAAKKVKVVSGFENEQQLKDAAVRVKNWF